MKRVGNELRSEIILTNNKRNHVIDLIILSNTSAVKLIRKGFKVQKS